MYAIINSKTILFAFVASLLFTACKKDKLTPQPFSPTEPKPFYDEAYGSFYYSQLRTTVMKPGTWQDWYAVKATGTAINMTNTKSLASFYVTMGTDVIEGKGTPANKTFKEELATTKYSNLPDDVNHIIYDDNGNSLWLHIERISMSTVRSTMYVFDGTRIVIGGTGLYARATGTIYLSGQIDFTNPMGSMLRNEGTVSY